MKIVIKYFSGSGNTEFISRLLAEDLRKDGAAVDCSPITEETVWGELDLLIIGGPIYAGNCPEKLIRWVLRSVPVTATAKAFVYTTSAGLLNAFGANALSTKLAKKGYTVIGNECFVLPRNFYFGSYEPTEEAYSKELFTKARERIAAVENLIHSKPQQAIQLEGKGVLGKDLFAELFSVMAPFMGKNYRANDNCTRCMKCIRNCPQQNISLKGSKIVFGFKCMMCTKCIHGCPAHAIEYKGTLYRQYRPADYVG